VQAFIEQFGVIILAAPLLGAAINGLFGRLLQRRYGEGPIGFIAAGAVGLSFFVSCVAFFKVGVILLSSRRIYGHGKGKCWIISSSAAFGDLLLFVDVCLEKAYETRVVHASSILLLPVFHCCSYSNGVGGSSVHGVAVMAIMVMAAPRSQAGRLLEQFSEDNPSLSKGSQTSLLLK